MNQMREDAIYFGVKERAVKENELCRIIIMQLSKGNQELVSNMLDYHMEEIRNISRSLINRLGGTIIGARTLNNYFYETVSSLGYSTSLLCSGNVTRRAL